MCAGSFLDVGRSPIVAVSSLTGAGLGELKSALAQVASEVAAKNSGAMVRLPIDRVFTMKGFGTVVTGTLVAGTIRKEEELEVFPLILTSECECAECRFMALRPRLRSRANAQL